VISREIRRRIKGKAPPQADYLDAVMPLIGRLGVARATYAITTVLTAVAGAPGTVGACLLYEFLNRPDWAERIRAELRGVSVEELIAAPVHSAPVAHRFVKEVLRLWAFPLIIQRNVYRDFQVDDYRLAEGEVYFLSPYVVHRDEAYWDDPQRFDPDRWLRYEKPSTPGAYAPFGWGPRTCVGGAFGMSQMMMFVHLIATRFDFELTTADKAYMDLDGMAAPAEFHGIVRPRPADGSANGSPSERSRACSAHSSA
jgi:cytochrome P450